MSSKISFEVGNGQRVRFWKDKWCGIDPLRDSFPSLFSLACSKDAWVEDVWDFSIPGEGVGARLSLDPSMIGKWKVRRGFCLA